MGKENVIQLKVRNEYDGFTVTHKLTHKEEIEFLEQEMLEQGEIQGLFPVEIQEGVFGTKMQVFLEGCISLSEYLMSRIPLKDLCRSLIEIIHIIQDCESHGINTSNLEMRSEYMYYDTRRQMVRMLYWPINSMKEYPDVRRMFLELINVYRYRENEKRRFFQLAEFIGRREPVYLAEWEKKIAVYAGMQSVSGSAGRQYALYHVTRQRWVMLNHFPFSVGRKTESCDYAVDDTLMSRRHFSIELGEHDIYLVDAGSSNGTKVDGQLLLAGKRALLKNRSVIEAGNQKFQFFTESYTNEENGRWD